MRIALICGVSALALTTAALAVNSSIPVLRDIELFATGTAPASVTKKSTSAVEKQSAITGSGYAVVQGAVDSVGALNSYLRLFNGGALAANFSVTVVNETTGASLGTTNYSIPPMASKQYIMSDIVKAVSPTTAAGGTYSIYLQSAEATAGYQHVTFNGVTSLYENASICKNLLNQVTAPVSSSIVMLNIHTSIIEAFGYPMKIQLHNFAETQKTYVATVYEATTGVRKGATSFQVQANSSYTIPFVSGLQTAVGWTPSSAAGENFANVVITDSTGASPNVMVGSSIDTSGKLGANAFSNMSTACAVNAASSASTGGGGSTDPGGGFGGGSTY